MFREHVAFGAIISMVVVVAVYFYALVTDPILLLFLFGVTVAGSFLPDVDSDSGMPFYLVFGTMSLAATGVVLLYTLDSSYAGDWRYLTGIPAAALFFFWFVVGGLVKKCTHHRGIFHSLPATAIAALGALLVARYYGLPEEVAWIFGGGMAAGYLCHLVLDEVHAGVTLDGIPFNPKESFGSALKLFSRSSRVNTATYLILAALAYTALEPQMAYAFYNDSNVIEIEDDAPPVSSGGSGGTEDGGGTGSGAGQGGGASGSEEETEGNGGNTGGGENSSEESGEATSEGGSGTANNEADEALLSTLVEAGIISGSGTLSGSSLFEDSRSGWSGGVVHVDGDSVRRYFRGRYDVQDLLLSWRMGNKARLSAQGLGYVAASTALRDRNVANVSFSADAFEIRYRSRGYLFSFIPMTFPVRVTVSPEATLGRVVVKLPWYRFFVREFFTARGLADDVDAVIQAEIEKNTARDIDLRAELFVAVANYLRTKVGTVSDTVGAE
jgi:hypothetical protein